ncbi:MAG: beta-galactosidase, partial [Armatimonadetes bacterium]|nr:beta-galactosidase [Armatimonadota bacterium]
MCPLTLTLLAGLVVMVALCAEAAPARAPGFAGEVNRVTVWPREIDDVLYNPGIGFTTMGNFDGDVPNHPKSTIAYFRWYWDAIEPKTGGYRWDIVDDTIEKARAQGQRVALGIMPVNGRAGAPQWFRDLGAKGWDFTTGGSKAGWMPDHNDPLYLKHWGRLVR